MTLEQINKIESITFKMIPMTTVCLSLAKMHSLYRKIVSCS